MADKLEKEVVAKRKATRDAHAKKSLRDKISFTKTLQSIDKAENILETMIKEPETTSSQVGVINALLNSKWKKMDRLLPVLKAIEVQGQVDTDVTFRWLQK